MLLEFHFVIYCILILIPLNFFYFFLFPFSHLHFFTCRHMPEIFVILKFIDAIFGFGTIFFFFVAFYTLHFYQFVHFAFYSSLVRNVTSFYLLKKCLPISITALIFFFRYIYIHVYVCIYTSFSYTSLQKWTFFLFELFRIRKNWRTGEIRNKFHAKLRKHNNMYIKLKRTPKTDQK
jgi:hypothetical protein